MKLLILTHQDIEKLLPMDRCIEVMADALSSLAKGEAHQPLRMIIRPPQASGMMGLMPAQIGGERPAYGLKAICVFPGNSSRGKDIHQGGVMLFDNDTGELLAVMNASAITAIRTAAVSGLATRLLAREDARVLAIVGVGVQARSHLAAMACVRSLAQVRVVSRTHEKARQFAEEMQQQFPFPIESCRSPESAVRGADLVVTATTASEPVLRREWIQSGAHINAIGASLPSVREVDSPTMAACSLFVDRRESAMNEAGDYLLAVRDGAIGPEHIRAEIGEVLLRTKPGRTSADEMTLFKSLGLAVEDVAAARYLYGRAKAEGAGTWAEF